MEDSSTEEDIKENASVVDSSLTEGKHDMENCDGQESSLYKERHCPGVRGEQTHPFCEEDDWSPLRKATKPPTRYFIIKSLSYDNIQLSIEKGIWATQVMNEPILDEAFHKCDRVILIFSVNMSGFFQGYAQMVSSVGWRRDSVWTKSSGRNNPWGRSFKVKWLRLQNLPFHKTLHLKNPLNDNKPVKISRDCQELPKDVGEALCELFDREVDTKGKQKRNNCFVDGISLKRPCRNSHITSQDEESMLSVDSSHIMCSGAVRMRPAMLHQDIVQHEMNGHHVPLERHRNSFPEGIPSHLESHNVSQMKQMHVHEGLPVRQFDRSLSLHPNSSDRNQDGSPAMPLSEEDILDMTYEEYLDVISRSSVPSTDLAAGGSSWTMQGPNGTREQDKDIYPNSLADWHHSQNVNGGIYSYY